MEKDYLRALGLTRESHGVNRVKEISFDNSGVFLSWWFEDRSLTGKAQEIFERYYAQYRLGFDGYLKKAWTERHLELESELGSIGDKSNIKILDLGCGTGSIALYIAGKFGEKCDVFGLDINQGRLLCARERQKILEEKLGYKLRCRYIESNVLSLNEECKFDLIYLEETLHHMEPRLEVVAKISNLLNSGGTLIISEANAWNPFMQLSLLKQRGLRTIVKKLGKNGEPIWYGVERIVRASSVSRLFRKYGVEVKSVRYFRIGSSQMGRFADKCGIDLHRMEKKLCKMPILRNLFSVHYNMVFSKEGRGISVRKKSP